MRMLTQVVDSIALWMHRLSGLLLILMMAVVVVDVATRSLYAISDGRVDLTFLGGIELVSFGLLFCILFALPHCVDKGQVVVDLFTQNISKVTQKLVSGIYILGFAALGLAMSGRFFHAYESALTTQETSQDLLLPLADIYLVVVVATFCLGLRSLLVGINGLISVLSAVWRADGYRSAKINAQVQEGEVL
ncbi:MAG: TRAP transporter small permease subunit [Motiliproteus sp.]